MFGLSKDLILFLFSRVIFLSILFVAEPILECIWFGLVQVKREDRNKVELTTSGAACVRVDKFLHTQVTTGVRLLPPNSRSQYHIFTVEISQNK